MRLFGIRVLYGPGLNSIVKEHNKNYTKKLKREDFFYKFFTKKEISLLKPVYMTIYKGRKDREYVMFTTDLPRPGGKMFNNIESLIGAETGYNTKVISCEKCYIIG